MMKDLLLWILVILGAIIIWTYLVGEVNEKQASRLYARAHIIETQNEARKDLLAVLMPYVVIAVSLIAGVTVVIVLTYGLIAVTTIWINRPLPPPPPETHIIERQVIVMLQDGQSRKDFFKQLEQSANIKLLK